MSVKTKNSVLRMNLEGVSYVYASKKKKSSKTYYLVVVKTMIY
jgi:hypothetical protein